MIVQKILVNYHIKSKVIDVKTRLRDRGRNVVEILLSIFSKNSELETLDIFSTESTGSNYLVLLSIYLSWGNIIEFRTSKRDT